MTNFDFRLQPLIDDSTLLEMFKQLKEEIVNKNYETRDKIVIQNINN